MKECCTSIFEKITHACAAGEDELGDVLDDLGLVLGRESGEPFCETLSISVSFLRLPSNWVTYDFTLPRKQDEVAVHC